MNEIWVDTDLGFDDLWALLVLRRAGVRIAGISLVAGVADMPRTIANARGAAQAYGLDARFFAGAAKPLRRARESAARILGPRGMQSRGRHLPDAARGPQPNPDAVGAMARWLADGTPDSGRPVLAIGPLTNIARLVQAQPAAAARITRLVWMGGSAGAGNHTAAAEFNALADPEAAAIVAGAGLPLDVVDLEICRQVTFTAADMAVSDPLTADLLGGYLDIARSRGRERMAIYDPVAALALVRPDLFRFRNCRMHVTTAHGARCGATQFSPDPQATSRLATGFAGTVPDGDRVRRLCLDALENIDAHAS